MNKPLKKLLKCEEVKFLLDKSSQGIDVNKSFRVLDASFHLNNSRNAREEFLKEHIPGAAFFDVHQQFASDDPRHAHLPHMIPSPQKFETEARKLNLKNDDHILVYDTLGQFSACRAWFLFKLFGHDTVSVIDGGLPMWKRLGYPLESGDPLFQSSLASSSPTSPTSLSNNYQVKEFRKDLVIDLDQVKQNIKTRQFKVVDARSRERFLGKVKEPREGLFSGRIPKSFNVPFDQLLNPEDKTFKTKEEIEKIFEKAGIDLQNGTQTVALSCGSGMTACVDLFALDAILGYCNYTLYDGSWSEYGQTSLNNEIEKD